MLKKNFDPENHDPECAKCRPTTHIQLGPYFRSKHALTLRAISLSSLDFCRAAVAAAIYETFQTICEIIPPLSRCRDVDFLRFRCYASAREIFMHVCKNN